MLQGVITGAGDPKFYRLEIRRTLQEITVLPCLYNSNTFTIACARLKRTVYKNVVINSKSSPELQKSCKLRIPPWVLAQNFIAVLTGIAVFGEENTVDHCE